MNNHAKIDQQDNMEAASALPFKGFEYQGYAVKPGMILVKPNVGVVIVGGAKRMHIGQGADAISLTTIKLHEVNNLTNISAPPKDKFESNGLRLPCQFDEAYQALGLLVHGKANRRAGGWKHHAEHCQTLLKSGKPHEVAQVLVNIFAEKTVKVHEAMSNLSMSEREIADRAFKALSNEIGVSINFKRNGARDLIISLLESKPAIAANLHENVQSYQQKYDPYISDREFIECFRRTKKEALLFEAEEGISTSSLTAPARFNSPVATTQTLNYVTQPIETSVRTALPTVRKRFAISGKSVTKKMQAKQKDHSVAPANRQFFDQHKDEVPVKGIVRKLYNICGERLEPKAFQLHAQMYCFPSQKMSLQKAASVVGVTIAEAKIIHDQTVDVLMPHFGKDGVLLRKPGFLKKTDEIAPKPSKPARPVKEKIVKSIKVKHEKIVKTLPILSDNIVFFDAHKSEVPQKGALRRLFNIAAEKLPAKSFQLHAQMYCFPSQKMSLQKAASVVGVTIAEAKIIHDQTVDVLMPHFGKEGIFIRKPGFLKKTDEAKPVTKKTRKLRLRSTDRAIPKCHEGFTNVTVAVPTHLLNAGRDVVIVMKDGTDSADVVVRGHSVTPVKTWRCK